MDNFNLKEYLADNPLLQELAMERSQIYLMMRTYLDKFQEFDAMAGTTTSDFLAQQLTSDFKNFSFIEDPKEVSKVVMNMEDEFLELFTLLGKYFDYREMSAEEVLTDFVNYLRYTPL